MERKNCFCFVPKKKNNSFCSKPKKKKKLSSNRLMLCVREFVSVVATIFRIFIWSHLPSLEILCNQSKIMCHGHHIVHISQSLRSIRSLASSYLLEWIEVSFDGSVRLVVPSILKLIVRFVVRLVVVFVRNKITNPNTAHILIDYWYKINISFWYKVLYQCQFTLRVF